MQKWKFPVGFGRNGMNPCAGSFGKIQTGDEFPAPFSRGKSFPWETESRISKSLECLERRSFCLPAELPLCFPMEQQMDVQEEQKQQKNWNKSRWRNVWNESLGIKEWQFICAWNLQFLAWKPNFFLPIMEIWAGSRQGFDFFRIWAPAREICWSRAGIIHVLEVKHGIWWKSSCLGWGLEGWDLIPAFR